MDAPCGVFLKVLLKALKHHLSSAGRQFIYPEPFLELSASVSPAP